MDKKYLRSKFEKKIAKKMSEVYNDLKLLNNLDQSGGKIKQTGGEDEDTERIPSPDILTSQKKNALFLYYLLRKYKNDNPNGVIDNDLNNAFNNLKAILELKVEGSNLYKYQLNNIENQDKLDDKIIEMIANMNNINQLLNGNKTELLDKINNIRDPIELQAEEQKIEADNMLEELKGNIKELVDIIFKYEHLKIFILSRRLVEIQSVKENMESRNTKAQTIKEQLIKTLQNLKNARVRINELTQENESTAVADRQHKDEYEKLIKDYNKQLQKFLDELDQLNKEINKNPFDTIDQNVIKQLEDLNTNFDVNTNAIENIENLINLINNGDLTEQNENRTRGSGSQAQNPEAGAA